MKIYHTYGAIDVAWSLLRHAKKQGKSFCMMRLQLHVYICHGLSLAYLARPLILDDVFAWKFGPIVPSIYFRFKEQGAATIANHRDVLLDTDSEAIIQDVVLNLGHLAVSQLLELAQRPGSPWHQVWDGKHKQVIPDPIIQTYYQKVLEAGRAGSL